jgi:adenosylcobinamide-GDP ribazoletransferase
MLVAMRLLPYGRGEEGIAHDLTGKGGRFHWYWWAAILVLASLLAGWPGVLLINAAFWATLFALLVFYSSRMGCVTGDMVGAAGEIAETAMLLSLTVRW